MNRTLILTGGTGAIGVPLLAELLKARIFERIIVLVRTEPTKLHAALQCESPGLDTSSLETLFTELGATSATTALASLPAADCVIHGAACTQFRAPVSLLEATNIEGTRQILEWAASQSKPPRILHLSTTCVAGQRTGEIAEAALTEDRGFVNHYERTKWEAEQLAGASTLQPEIIRAATVIGSARDGRLHRPGAFHTTLRWLHKGLLPLVPGDENTRLDLIPTELVTETILRLLRRNPEPGGIYQISCGSRGLPLGELMDFATQRFSEYDAAWRSGQILPPVPATRQVFEDFRATVIRSGDFLFNQVIESVDSFLPELFYPKSYSTGQTEAVWGSPLPLPNWREWIKHVLDYAIETDFGRQGPKGIKDR